MLDDGLDRFLVGQEGVYPGVLDELRSGHKSSHWIWFIFPQIGGLGHSAMSQHFAIGSLDEARAYLADPVLGPRLRGGARLVSGRREGRHPPRGDPGPHRCDETSVVHDALPSSGARANWSSALVLGRYYDGVADPVTDALLEIDWPARIDMARCQRNPPQAPVTKAA